MKKILLSSYCDGYNFGSLLQCFALKKYLTSCGYDVDVCSNKKSKIFQFLFRGFFHPLVLKKFIKSRKASNNEFSAFQIKKFQDFIDFLEINYLSFSKHRKLAYSDNVLASIAGSDQVWNSESLFISPYYFLSYSPYKKNIAYAPSFGRNYIPKYNINIIERKIKKIRFLSTREILNKSLLENISHRNDVAICCDPVFLISEEEWNETNKPLIEQDYVLCYVLNTPDNIVVNQIVSKLNSIKKTVIFVGNSFEGFKNDFKFDFKFISIDVLDFPNLIFNSNFVITDSFHGIAFSIIGKKKIWLIERNYSGKMNQNIRIESLFLSCNYQFDKNSNDVKEIEFCNDNYMHLNKFINESKDYLLGSLSILENE